MDPNPPKQIHPKPQPQTPQQTHPTPQIAWNDPANPAVGFKYLYLSPEDYEGLKPGTVNAQLVEEEGEKRYALSDIIGQVRGRLWVCFVLVVCVCVFGVCVCGGFGLVVQFV
jgi:hypothetical protein